MKVLAYAIWFSLGTCMALGIFLLIFARLHKHKKQANPSTSLAPEPATPILCENRWNQLVDMLHLQNCTFPADGVKRVVWAHDALGIEKDWLQGQDAPMYPFLSFHNAVEKSIDFIDTLKQGNAEVVLYVVKPSGILLAEEIMEACAILCFATPVRTAECNAWHFYPVNVYWEWGYPPERVQCSQIIHTAVQARVQIKGVEVDQADIYSLLEGRNIPLPLALNTDSSWNPNTVANAGENLTGVTKGMLSEQDLKQQIDAQDWD